MSYQSSVGLMGEKLLECVVTTAVWGVPHSDEDPGCLGALSSEILS